MKHSITSHSPTTCTKGEKKNIQSLRTDLSLCNCQVDIEHLWLFNSYKCNKYWTESLERERDFHCYNH